jgi:hypothetical protein
VKTLTQVVIENQIAFRVVVHPDFPEEAFGIRLFFHDRGFQGKLGRIDWLPIFTVCQRGSRKGGK